MVRIGLNGNSGNEHLSSSYDDFSVAAKDDDDPLSDDVHAKYKYYMTEGWFKAHSFQWSYE